MSQKLIFVFNILLCVPSCPDIEKIKNVGLAHAEYYHEKSGSFRLVITDRYKTNQNWRFSIAGIIAEDETDALKKAQNALNALSGNPKAFYNRNGEDWVCQYNIDNAYSAKAVTPVN